MSELEAYKELNKIDETPWSCPWCSFAGSFTRHAPKVHPEKWEQWKAGHEKVNVNTTIWVDK